MKVIRWLFLVAIAILVVAFAVANRQSVLVSLDPFNSADPALGLQMPFSLALLAALFLGIVIGGWVSWRAGIRRRKALRQQIDALSKPRKSESTELALPAGKAA